MSDNSGLGDSDGVSPKFFCVVILMRNKRFDVAKAKNKNLVAFLKNELGGTL